MSLLDNIDKAAYNTLYPTETIVKNFTGSFNYTTDTITRNYTLAGFANPVKAFRIPHGYTRPLFVELFWSLDNSTFTIGGGSNDAGGYYTIAYSDSTYVYVQPTALPANTRLYYKTVCSWIKDYDTTNPSVPAFSDLPSAYTQVFNSRNSVPAIIQQDVVNMSTSSTSLTPVVTPVAHPFGYAPNMKVYVEAFSGEVWPLNYGGASNPYLVDDGQVEAQAFTDTSNLILDASMKASMGTKRMWYMLYAKRSGFLTANYGMTQSAL